MVAERRSAVKRRVRGACWGDGSASVGRRIIRRNPSPPSPPPRSGEGGGRQALLPLSVSGRGVGGGGWSQGLRAGRKETSVLDRRIERLQLAGLGETCDHADQVIPVTGLADQGVLAVGPQPRLEGEGLRPCLRQLFRHLLLRLVLQSAHPDLR